MWKEGVRVGPFMEAQKAKKILFERLFNRNKKINRGQILSETNRRK